MTNKPDNPPAFPVAEDHKIADDFPWAAGMTLRDYFAAKAMQGMMSFPGTEAMGNYHNNCDTSDMASEAYRIADAMLKERERSDA